MGNLTEPQNYSTNLAPAYIAEQIFFHVLMHGGEGNPFRAISSKWFVKFAAPKIRELLTKAESKPEVNSCNRHVDCEMAVKGWLEKHPGKTRTDIPISFHCHDEECEDCFGC